MKKIFYATFLFLMLFLLIPTIGLAYTETFYLTATGAGTKAGTSLANAMSPTEWNNSSNWDTDDQDDDKIGPNDITYVYDDHGVIRATLEFQQDGLNGKPIVLMNAANETVAVSGADLVTGWTSYSGNIYYATVSYGTTATMQAWEDVDTWLLPKANTGSMVQGSSYLNTGQNRLYVWSSDDADPTTHTIEAGARDTGIGTMSPGTRSYVEIRGNSTGSLTIRNVMGTSGEAFGIFLTEGGDWNVISGDSVDNRNLIVKNVGRYNGGVSPNAMDGINMKRASGNGCTNNLMQYLEITACVDKGIQIWGNYNSENVIRYNYIHDNGTHNLAPNSSAGTPASDQFLFEGNILGGANRASDNVRPGDAGAGFKFDGASTEFELADSIVRYNEAYENYFAFSAMDTTDEICFYNNTAYDNYAEHGPSGGFGFRASNLSGNIYLKNNIFYSDYSAGIWFDQTSVNTGGHYIDYNLVERAGDDLRWGDSGYLTHAEWVAATAYGDNDLTEDPLFNAPGGGDFTLQANSNCIDAGIHLTEVAAGDSGSGTALIVDDATYFQDGWAGVDADYIAVKTVTNIHQISSINYSTDTITLATDPGARSENDAIWLYKDSGGNIVLHGTAPDMGANEYSASITATLSGTLVAGGVTEAEIVSGGETLIVTLLYDTFVPTFGDDNQITTDFIAGLDSGGSETGGWDNEVKGNLVFGDVARTNDTTATITLQAEASYAITSNETITLTIPASSLTESDSPIVATPTFPITAALDPAAALTGTLADNATEAQIVTGSQTLIITLTNDTWVAAGGTFDGERQNIIDGMDSAQSETLGWNAEVRDKMAVGVVVRTNATTVTITLTAAAAYDISANESVTMTVPDTALVTSDDAVVATPGFAIIFFDTSTEEIVGMTLQ